MLTAIINGHLVAFHAWISKLGISTFDYIGYKKDLREKLNEVKAGRLSLKEFDDWKAHALIFPVKRKSKIVTRRFKPS